MFLFLFKLDFIASISTKFKEKITSLFRKKLRSQNKLILNVKQEIVKIDDEDLKNNENFCCVCLIGVIIVITRIELEENISNVLFLLLFNNIKKYIESHNLN